MSRNEVGSAQSCVDDKSISLRFLAFYFWATLWETQVNNKNTVENGCLHCIALYEQRFVGLNTYK